MIAAPDSPDQDHEAATMSLRTFMRLPALQRSAVILKDVLGHSLGEVAREFAKEPADVSLPTLSDGMRARLITYVEGFKIGELRHRPRDAG